MYKESEVDAHGRAERGERSATDWHCAGEHGEKLVSREGCFSVESDGAAPLADDSSSAWIANTLTPAPLPRRERGFCPDGLKVNILVLLSAQKLRAGLVRFDTCGGDLVDRVPLHVIAAEAIGPACPLGLSGDGPNCFRGKRCVCEGFSLLGVRTDCDEKIGMLLLGVCKVIGAIKAKQCGNLRIAYSME